MRKRKYLCGMLAAFMTLTVLVLPVSAIDVNETSTGGTATVSYNNDSTWTAAIPMYVAPNNVGQQNVSDYKVSVQDVVIGDKQELAATIEYSGYVTEENGMQIPYQLYDSTGKEIQSGDTVISQNAGEPNTETAVTFGAALTDTPKYAGVYTDTATFSFSVQEKVYTAEEIEADDHLYEIGSTGSSVIAAFNDDYSAVDIFANGADSRGATANFSRKVSPVAQHADTLVNVTIDDNVTSLGNALFWNCTNIQEVFIPASVSYICCNETYPTFYGCTALTTITVDTNNKWYSSENGVLFNKNKTELLHYPHGKTELSYVVPEGVEVIGERAFNDQKVIQSVVLSPSVKTIDKYGFADCNALTSITFGDNIEKLEFGAFYNCTALKSVSFPDGFKSVGQNAFENCLLLEEVNLPKTVTSIGSTAFRSCRNLKSIELPDGVSLGGSVFYNAGLEKITVPGGINLRTTPFSDLKNLEEVILMDGITTIPTNAFRNCIKLNKVTIPASVESIAEDAFTNCTALTTIYGTSGSYAETWAAENGYSFIAQ